MSMREWVDYWINGLDLKRDPADIDQFVRVIEAAAKLAPEAQRILTKKLHWQIRLVRR